MSQRGVNWPTAFYTPSQAHKDELCRGSAGSGPSLETSDVTLAWDDGKRVKAHKDKLCNVARVLNRSP